MLLTDRREGHQQGQSVKTMLLSPRSSQNGLSQTFPAQNMYLDSGRHITIQAAVLRPVFTQHKRFTSSQKKERGSDACFQNIVSVCRTTRQTKKTCLHDFHVTWPHIMRNINQVRAPVKSSAPHHCSTSASTSSEAAVATVAAAGRVELPADRDRDQLLHHVAITGRIIIIICL